MTGDSLLKTFFRASLCAFVSCIILSLFLVGDNLYNEASRPFLQAFFEYHLHRQIVCAGGDLGLGAAINDSFPALWGDLTKPFYEPGSAIAPFSANSRIDSAVGRRFGSVHLSQSDARTHLLAAPCHESPAGAISNPKPF